MKQRRIELRNNTRPKAKQRTNLCVIFLATISNMFSLGDSLAASSALVSSELVQALWFNDLNVRQSG